MSKQHLNRAWEGRAAIITLGSALAALGCAGPVDEPLAHIDEDLYLTGRTWGGGQVNVCFDGTDGNNPTLISQAQTLLRDSWSRAANITFPGRGPAGQVLTNWEQCDYSPPRNASSFSTVAVHFCGGTSNSPQCPASDYDDNKIAAGGFRGVSGVGMFKPGILVPGITHLSLISDDTTAFQARFRYEVVHEFGHALGFAHEQDRPDNFNGAGNPIFCLISAQKKTGGTTETTLVDVGSIMSYCITDPLVPLSFGTMLSNGDAQGIRIPYGRLASSHGFMIQSDPNSALAVNAFGGAAPGTVLKLHDACTAANPDCTWSYQRGMLVSDSNPTLAINAFNGAAEGTVLKLVPICMQANPRSATNSACDGLCTQDNPDCTWTYKGGQFLSDRDSTLAIKADGGARFGATLVTTRACTASDPDCAWKLPHVMLSSHRNATLKINALNGATNGAPLALHKECDQSNPNCTWTFSKGMLISDGNTGLAVNAFLGARDGASVQLDNGCTPANPDCTWTWRQGQLISDNTANGTFPINAVNGAVHLASLKLSGACTAGNPDCVFWGMYAKN